MRDGKDRVVGGRSDLDGRRHPAAPAAAQGLLVSIGKGTKCEIMDYKLTLL